MLYRYKETNILPFFYVDQENKVHNVQKSIFVLILSKIKRSMSRVLTGIQSTGVPHLGNILGAIIPAIELSKDSKNESLFFIADMHSLTSMNQGPEDGENIRNNT